MSLPEEVYMKEDGRTDMFPCDSRTSTPEYCSNYDDIKWDIGTMDDSRPYGCKCQTLRHKVVGDGCDECNPEYAAQFEEEDE